MKYSILLSGFSAIAPMIFENAHAFSLLPGPEKRIKSPVSCQAARRDIVAAITGGVCSLVFNPVLPGNADDNEDLASKLFNTDGSLKEGVESEAKERSIQLAWDVTDSLSMNIDGVNIGDTKDGSQIKMSYKFPVKWSDGKDGDDIYFDRSEGTNAKACKRITVYQAPGKAPEKQLEKASTIGVAKAFEAPEELKRLYKADIISGRVATRNGRIYYDFDLAAAPETCGNSAENLGLGFCPYDNIFLLSATVVEDRLYCIVVECDSTRIWKLASSDLKRVRSSFVVEN
jgi:hypothetical protein